MDLYTVGDMPVDVLQERIHGLNDHKLKLEAELEKIKQEQAEKMSQEETMDIVNSFGELLERGDFDESREVVGALIEKVVIDGDNITIHWTFA